MRPGNYPPGLIRRRSDSMNPGKYSLCKVGAFLEGNLGTPCTASQAYPLQPPTRRSAVALGSEVKDSIPGEIHPKQTLVSTYDTTHLVGVLKPPQTLHNCKRCLKGFESFNAHWKRTYLYFNICTLVEYNNYYCIIQFIIKCRDVIWIS